jgi:hypothetical protein
VGWVQVVTGAELAARFMMLGPDHREVFDLLLDKAEGGAKKYGVMEIATDSRDFEAEARAELLDCIHYLGAECVKRGRVVAAQHEQLALARQEIEALRNRLSVAQRLVPR